MISKETILKNNCKYFDLGITETEAYKSMDEYADAKSKEVAIGYGEWLLLKFMPQSAPTSETEELQKVREQLYELYLQSKQ